MANPKVPPEIARKIAAMKGAAPAPGKPVTPQRAPAAAPAGPKAPGNVWVKVAAAGWLAAAGAGGAAYFIQTTAQKDKDDALAAQAADYEAKLQKVTGEAAAAVKTAQDNAAAQLTVIQTELDFQKMPELPLETTFRAGQVLYVESRLDEPFTCKVRLFRPSNNTSREVDFTMKARTYQDLAAIGDWLFARGDKVEFVKSGFKPRSLTVP